MYLPAIEPIVRVCGEAIDRGLTGDISGARKLIDRVRTMRAWLARSVNSHRNESLDIWIESSGIQESEILHYKSQTTQLNARLKIIRDWLSSSASAFSQEELITSPEGLSLFLDTVLPEIWDFSQDVVVLHGDHRRALFEDLQTRGQKNIVVIVKEGENADQVLMPSNLGSGHAGDERKQDLESINIVSFPTGSSVATAGFHKLVDQEVPSIVLVGTESNLAAEADFERIYKSMAAVLLGKKSAKELPVIFTEQWLKRVPALTCYQSVQVLKSLFADQDILIASPGPSLYESLADLKANRAKFLVIAPIRSLLTLLNADIVPDFAFHVDPTDFSEVIPNHPSINRVSLICTDYAHASVFEGGFGNIYTVPNPSMLGSAINTAFHGEAAPSLEGGCVATCAVGLAAQFKARSITLVGQDLSLSRGRYVEQVGGAFSNSEQTLKKDDPKDFLTCEGINGERLQTRHDYHWFIGEMESVARFFSPDVEFINSTAHGALLRGWLHKTLDEHPCLVGASVKQKSRLPTMSANEQSTRSDLILRALQSEREDAEQAAQFCADLVEELQSLIAAGSNDVTKLDSLELPLQSLLGKKGSLLRFYTSRFSMALVAASKSVKSLEENFNISAEYYHQVERRAEKLAAMLEDAFNELKSLRTSGKAASGG